MKTLIRWISNNKLEFIVLLVILIVSLGMRLYKIDQYMTFLGDEGRDAIVIKGILVNHHFPLLGPPTSIGNMYLGPLYYYMMAVAMAVAWLNPVAAAVMVAFVGVATIGLIYYLTRQWFGSLSAVMAAALYSFSPVNIIYSRSSWNPNPAPFFALLSVLGFYLARKTGNYLWLILSGGALAFAPQMHYLALILLPTAFVWWVYEIVESQRVHKKLRHFKAGTIWGAVLFCFLMSPLVIFDLHHNFMNFRAISTFFGDRQTTVNLNVFNTLSRIPTIFTYNLVGRYLSTAGSVLNWVISILIIIPVLRFLFLLIKKRVFSWPLFILSSWLVIGVLGLSLYKQSLFDHYLGFLNPTPFILLGAVFDERLLSEFKIKKIIYRPVALVILVVLLILSIQKSPLKQSPNNELKRTQEIAKYVIEKSDNQPFNFALLAEHNYDSAYQYYLDIYGHPPQKVPFVITKQLFVVCEDPICKPINNPKYEIAAFGWSKVETQTDFDGVKVFKLVHNVSPAASASGKLK